MSKLKWFIMAIVAYVVLVISLNKISAEDEVVKTTDSKSKESKIEDVA